MCVSTKTLQVTLLYISHYTKTHFNIINSCTTTYPQSKLYTSRIVIQTQHALTISKYMLHVQPVLLNLDKKNLQLRQYVTPTYWSARGIWRWTYAIVKNGRFRK